MDVKVKHSLTPDCKGLVTLQYKHLTMTSRITSFLITVNVWLNGLQFKKQKDNGLPAKNIMNVARQVLVM